MYVVSHYQARVSHRGLVVLETVVNLLASFPLTHHIHDLNSPPPPPPSPLHHPLPHHDNEGLIQEYWCPYREGPNVQPFIDNLGGMNVHCPDCGALHWLREKLSKSSNHNPCFGSCCLQGQVQLPIPHPPPSLLQCLLTVHSNTPLASEAFKAKAQEFCKNI